MNAAWSDRRNLATLERVFRCIFFRVSDQQTAEDLTSQVFLKAWEKLGQYPIPRQVVTLEDAVVQDGGADKPKFDTAQIAQRLG